MSEQKLFDNLFLSIGAMKAGTTWLYAQLAGHPELHFTLEKEIHYFYHRYVHPAPLNEAKRLKNARNRYLKRALSDKTGIAQTRDDLRWVGAYLDNPVDDNWYRNLFDMQPGQSFACDFSNLNCRLPADAWPKISAICGRLRVLFTMRDPIKRLWSHTKFHLEVTKQFDQVGAWGPAEYESFTRQPALWENTEYGAALRRLREGLPPDSYKVIFYEDIHNDQIAMLRQIEDFLSLKPHDYPEAIRNKRFVASARLEMPEFFPGLFAADVERIRAEIEAEGYTLPAAWG